MEPISIHEITGQHYSATLALDTPINGYIRITPAIVATDVLWSSDLTEVDVDLYVTTRSASLFAIDATEYQHTLEDNLDKIVDGLKAVIAALDAVEQGEWEAI